VAGDAVLVPSKWSLRMSFAAVTTAILRAIEDDRFPHAPRLDPLRARRWESSTRPQS
jgi:hypothetical protein